MRLRVSENCWPTSSVGATRSTQGVRRHTNVKLIGACLALL
jgi:hypothetical protein